MSAKNNHKEFIETICSVLGKTQKIKTKIVAKSMSKKFNEIYSFNSFLFAPLFFEDSNKNALPRLKEKSNEKAETIEVP